MVTIVSREQWGARPPRSRTPLDRSIQEGTALHYTAAAADLTAHHADCAGRVRNIQRYHQQTRGWADIAYSSLVCRHGYLFEGRGIGVRTAGQGTTEGNDRWHAVCFLGNDTAGHTDVTPQAKLALIIGIDRCNDWSGARLIEPHSFFKPTACPGDELRGWLAAGMPIEEDVMTPEQEQRLTDKIGDCNNNVINTYRQLAHGTTEKRFSYPNVEQVLAELAELREQVAAIGAGTWQPTTAQLHEIGTGAAAELARLLGVGRGA